MTYTDNESDRKTGRSTARRLLTLAYSCFTPGTEVEFRDHMPNTVEQAERHRDILCSYVELLDLPAKVVRRGKRVFITITPPNQA